MAAAAAARRLHLPVVDLASPDRRAAAKSIRQACMEYGFFYVSNHGVDRGLTERVFAESRRFFQQPMEEKMALRKNSSHRGYFAPYSEKSHAHPNSRGSYKESFNIGPKGDNDSQNNVNQWPSEECFPSWKKTMLSYHANAFATGKIILSLIALSLDLDAEFFQHNGDIDASNDGNIGAGPHSDFGMLTLLATDGTPGLQICREKDKHPQLWEDVRHIDGSTLHRVVPVGKERYSAAFFIDSSPNLVIRCMESCCNEAYPPRSPLTILIIDRFNLSRYGSHIFSFKF
ncbi:1-aminocyclopropane-1-carboxylate oxidase-like [Panicum miliaceum]|uniref:1-aminocyclopropane-1-carboxylate oxidase-like n=1 Tax=Panicum miliaceum TaxID=4540 RepID=A0A3L6QP04_PANMI|nr:1-aminocyclopropane-1-carboxylate oxidase-like [Panicum miliaceum]